MSERLITRGEMSPAPSIDYRAKVSELFLGGLDGAEKALAPEESEWLGQRAMEGKDRRRLLAGYANMAWMSERTGKDPSEIESRYPEFAAGLRAHFKLPPDADDERVYGAIQQWETETKVREDRTISAMASGVLSAAAAKNPLQAFREWRDKADPISVENSDDNADFLAFDHARRLLLSEWGEDNLAKVRGLLLSAKGEEGRGMEVPENKRDELLQWFAGLDAKKQDVVFGLVAGMAESANPEEKSGIEAAMAALDRGVFKSGVNWDTSQLMEFMKDGPWLVREDTKNAADLVLDKRRWESPHKVAADFSLEMMPAGYRMATPEESAALDQKLRNAESLSRAKMRFEQMRASAAPYLAKDKRTWLGNAGIVMGDTLPFMSQGFVPGVGFALIYEQTAGMRYHEYRDQGISPEKASSMASISAALETPVEILSNYALLGRFKKLRKALSIDPTKGRAHVAGAFTAQFLKGAGVEVAEEQIQDYMPKVVQNISRALGEDVPEVDWQKVNDEMWSGERFYDLSGVIVPMALLGGAIATATDMSTAEVKNDQRQALVDLGLTPEAVAEYMEIADPTERATAVAKEIARANVAKSPEAQEAFDMAANDTPAGPAMPRLTRDASGYVVSFPDDTFDRAPDLLTAKTMIKTWVEDAEARVEEDTWNAAQALQTGVMEGLAKHYEANPGEFGSLRARFPDEEGPVQEPDPNQTEEEIAAVRQDIASAVTMAGGEQAIRGATGWKIFGKTDIEFREGVADAVITIFKNGTVLDLFEEKGHAWWEAAYHAKWFTREEAIAQLRKVEQTTGDSYLADIDGIDGDTLDQAVMEGLAGWSMTWASGKVRNSQSIPDAPGIRAAMAAMKRFIRHILEKAARLYKMQRDGKLDARWEEYLNKSVGLDGARVEQLAADAATVDVAGAVLSPEEIKAAEIAGRLDALGLTEEQAVAIVESIEAQTPVEVSTDLVPDFKSKQEMREWINGQDILGNVEHPEIGTIEISKRGLKNVAAYSDSIRGNKKLAALLKIRELIAVGKEFHTHQRRWNMSTHRLAARVLIDGRDYVARIAIDTDSNGRRYYNHELSDLELLREGDTKTSPSPDSRGTSSSAGKDIQIGVEGLGDTARVLEFLFSVKKNRTVTRRATRPVGPDGRPVQVWTRNQVERLTRYLQDKFQGNPKERAEAAARAVTRIQALVGDARMRHARLSGRNASPADHDLEWLKAGMREFDVIIKILPPEARGMIDSTGLRNQVLEAKTSVGRANALRKLADRVSDELEQHLRLAERERIGEVLERSSPERTETRRIKGRISAEAHDLISMAEQAMALPRDKATSEIEEIKKEIADGVNGVPLEQAEVNARLATLDILEIFGGIDDPETSAATLSLARETLEEIHEHGRMTAAVLREERQAKAARLSKFLTDAVGKISTQYADKNQADTLRLRESMFQKLERALLNDFTAIPDLISELMRHTTDPATLDGLREIEDMLRHATNQASDNRIKTDEEWTGFLAEVFGPGWFNGSGRKLGKMATRKSRAGQITVRPAFRVDQPAIPLDRVPGILDGSLNLGYTFSDKDAIRDAWHAHQAEEAIARRQGKPSRKRKLQWSKWVSDPAKDIFLTEQEAINHSLLWRQEDLRPNMRRMGFDEITMEQIEKYISPEGKLIREWLGQRGEVEFPEIDKVSRAVNGVGLPKVKDHFRASFEHKKAEGAGLDPFNGGMGATSGQGTGRAGFSRHRVRHNADLRDVSALSVWQAHMEEVNHWKAWADPLDLLGAAFRDRKLRDTWRTALGENLASTIEQRFLMLGNAGVHRAGIRLAFDKLLGGWRSAAVMATLGLRIQTRLVQLSAFLGSLSSRDMSLASYLRGLMALAMDPMRYRQIYRSATIQRRVKLGNNWAMQIAKMGKDADPSWLSRAARVGVADLPYVDAWFTSISAAAAYDAGLRAAKAKGLEGTAAEEWAADFMDRVVMETAQPNTDFARSALEIQKSSDPVQWMIWPFASEPRLRGTKDALALRDILSPAKPGDMKRAVRVLIANRLLGIVTASMVYAWGKMSNREEDEDRAHEDWRWWAMMSLTGNFGGAPVIGDLAEHLAAVTTGQRSFDGLPILRDAKRGASAAWQILWQLDAEEEAMDGEQWLKAIAAVVKAGGVLDQRVSFFAQLFTLGQSVKGVAANISETPEEASAERAFQQLAKEQKEYQKARKVDLDKAEKELRALPEGQRWKALAERHAGDPETMRELMSRLRAPALEPDEARLRTFAVAGGWRAKAIAAAAKARGLEGDALKAWLNQLRAKRVLTREVEADLQKAMIHAEN